MNPETISKLVDLNQQFYQTFGREFSATRRRLQPGVKRVLAGLTGTQRMLDLGCGNGELARALSARGQRGSYLGLDFSPALLEEARGGHFEFPVKFLPADLTSSGWASSFPPASFDLIFAFAVLHHLPGQALREEILRSVHGLLAPGGKFILSNWQFLNSEKLRARIQPWALIGLADPDVDPGDSLIDWRAGGQGLRYVHQFSEAELLQLAGTSGFRVVESFVSDGTGGKLSLYQEWRSLDT